MGLLRGPRGLFSVVVVDCTCCLSVCRFVCGCGGIRDGDGDGMYLLRLHGTTISCSRSLQTRTQHYSGLVESSAVDSRCELSCEVTTSM